MQPSEKELILPATKGEGEHQRPRQVPARTSLAVPRFGTFAKASVRGIPAACWDGPSRRKDRT